jgi:hypothetical protein
MANQKLTQRSLATGVTLTDLIHIVITGDTTDDPAGSSYKATVGQMMDTISASTIMVIGVGTGSTERCSNSNSACGDYSTVSGGFNNASNGGYSTIRLQFFNKYNNWWWLSKYNINRIYIFNNWWRTTKYNINWFNIFNYWWWSSKHIKWIHLNR